jgi:hypothetical protein
MIEFRCSEQMKFYRRGSCAGFGRRPPAGQEYLAIRGRRIIQRGGPAPVMRRNRRRVGSCGNGPHGDRPGGFFLCRRRRAGFSVDEVADPRGWFVKKLAGSGVVQGLYQGWFTPLGHSVRGCFVIRFPARRRLDDRKHAISGVFRPIPSDRPSLCPRIAPYHLRRTGVPKAGSPPKRDTRAELYPLSRVVMEGRRLEYRVCQSSAPSGFVGWASTAQCSPLSRAVSRDHA